MQITTTMCEYDSAAQSSVGWQSRRSTLWRTSWSLPQEQMAKRLRPRVRRRRSSRSLL